MKQLKVLAGFVLLLGTVTAQAAIIYGSTSDSTNFGVYTNQSTYTSGGSAQTGATRNYDYVTLDRFDSSLGTLSGVNISFSGNWYHNVWGNSDDDSSWPYEDNVRVDGRGTAEYGLQLYDPYQSSAATQDSQFVYCSDNDGFCSDSSSSGNQNYSGSLNLGGFSLAQFIGTDALNLRAWNSQDADITSCDNGGSDDCTVRSYGNWSGQVTVAYTYYNNVIPEPGSFALMGLGLLAIGVARRRRSV